MTAKQKEFLEEINRMPLWYTSLYVGEKRIFRALREARPSLAELSLGVVSITDDGKQALRDEKAEKDAS